MTEQRSAWMQIPEVGSLLGMRIILTSMRLVGRRGTNIILRCISIYYVLVYARVRRSSREYLSLVLSEPVKLRHVFRHVWTFARVTADRALWATNQLHEFECHQHGLEHMEEQIRSGRGALFLAGHFGCGEALAAAAKPRDLRVNIAGHFKQSGVLNRVLDELAPGRTVNFLEIQAGRMNSVFQIRDHIEAGEIVVLAADRTGIGDRELPMEFLGNQLALPAGPFLLASILHCPVYFVAAVYTEPCRYDLYCQSLSSGIHATRGERDEAIASLAQTYATTLERFCRDAPYNWFNFYHVWKRAT